MFHHLSRPAITDRLKQPTHHGSPPGGETASNCLVFRDLFGLSTPGVYRNARHRARPWALTPRFHPYSTGPELVRPTGARRSGIFSVALFRTGPPARPSLLSQNQAYREPILPVRKRGALCCPDFPLPLRSGAAIERVHSGTKV